MRTIKEIESIERGVLGSLAIENAFPSPGCKKITRGFLEDKITSNIAIKRIFKMYGVRT